MKRDKIEIEHGRDGMWRWRYVASNGRIMADSAEGYVKRQAALDAVMRVCDLDAYAYEGTTHNFTGGSTQHGVIYRNGEQGTAFDLIVYS